MATLISLNDIHSEMNETSVKNIVRPTSVREIQDIVVRSQTEHVSISIMGGRHAMGGQQFGDDTTVIDMTGMNRIIDFNKNKGLLTVEAGIMWPEVAVYLKESQVDDRDGWSIAQKQTGADRLTIGGALSANVHGRGLTFAPFISDVETFWMVNAEGKHIECNRQTNSELFSLVIGGYGLFGVITQVTLRLIPRKKLIRVVEVIHVDSLADKFKERIHDGFLYGDFQFSTDISSDAFLTKGVFSCYKPIPFSTPEEGEHKTLSAEDWIKLFCLGHTDQKKVYELYTQYYLSTSGQIYDSDEHQKSYYPEGYHAMVDTVMKAPVKATEMITEIYVPRAEIASFMHEVAAYFRTTTVPVFYGTVRLIEKDTESFLAWAKESYVCIIFNLHVVHTAEDIEKAKVAFQTLIDLGLKRGGGYYLTYHTWARPEQVRAVYPQFEQFLKLKQQYDPKEVFQSNWYRLYKKMFSL
ncbi:MAG TPA: FAD-binding oxidoreductase [Candidatus Kapabacteria bacterium]|nr:FAD-binding oxidoreductase [Candidatus Kapabacteria bacterium]